MGLLTRSQDNFQGALSTRHHAPEQGHRRGLLILPMSSNFIPSKRHAHKKEPLGQLPTALP
jgi:hypothetical protein